MDSVSLVEQAILEADDYPTKAQLWEKFSPSMTRLELDDALGQLFFDNKIMSDKHGHIIYVGVNSPKLKKLLDESVPIR